MNELEKQVLQSIGENVTSPDVFADTDTGLEPIRDSINSAIEEIAILTGLYKEKYTLPMYQGQGFYRLKFNRGVFGWIDTVWLYNQRRRLEQTDFIKLNKTAGFWMKDTGNPWQYMQIGMDVIGVYPRPGGTTDILEIDCVTIPARYETSTDRIKLRENFKKTVVHYATSEYYASRGDAREAEKHFHLYADQLNLTTEYPMSQDRIRELQAVKREAN